MKYACKIVIKLSKCTLKIIDNVVTNHQRALYAVYVTSKSKDSTAPIRALYGE